MNYEHSQEGHLLACVLKDDPRIVRLAPKAVGGHHHSQVVYIHLGHSHVRWLREYLEVMKRWSHLAAVQVCNFKKKRVSLECFFSLQISIVIHVCKNGAYL